MHFHADRLSRYLRVQRQQGYWRVALHLEHPGRGSNRYSSTLDHLQPFVAAALVPAVIVAIAAIAAMSRLDGGASAAWPLAVWLLPIGLAAALL